MEIAKPNLAATRTARSGSSHMNHSSRRSPRICNNMHDACTSNLWRQPHYAFVLVTLQESVESLLFFPQSKKVHWFSTAHRQLSLLPILSIFLHLSPLFLTADSGESLCSKILVKMSLRDIRSSDAFVVTAMCFALFTVRQTWNVLPWNRMC